MEPDSIIDIEICPCPVDKWANIDLRSLMILQVNLTLNVLLIQVN